MSPKALRAAQEASKVDVNRSLTALESKLGRIQDFQANQAKPCPSEDLEFNERFLAALEISLVGKSSSELFCQAMHATSHPANDKGRVDSASAVDEIPMPAGEPYVNASEATFSGCDKGDNLSGDDADNDVCVKVQPDTITPYATFSACERSDQQLVNTPTLNTANDACGKGSFDRPTQLRSQTWTLHHACQQRVPIPWRLLVKMTTDASLQSAPARRVHQLGVSVLVLALVTSLAQDIQFPMQRSPATVVNIMPTPLLSMMQSAHARRAALVQLSRWMFA